MSDYVNTCIDIVENRLKVAQELGADGTILIKPGIGPEELSNEVKNVLGEKKPNVSIECSGAESSIKLAILATKSGGTVVLVGSGSPEVKIPVVNVASREVDIRGVFRYANW